MKQFQLYILPVSKKVIFPYQSLNIRIPDTYDYDPKKFNSLIGLVNIIDEIDNKDKIQTIDNLSRYGTILKINSEEKTYYTFQRDLSRTSREIRYYGGLAFGRFKVKELKQTTPYYLASVELLSDDITPAMEKHLLSTKGLVQELKAMARTYLSIIMKPDAALLKKQQIQKEVSINKLVFSICGIVDSTIGEKLQLLQIDNVEQRIKFLLKLMNKKNDELKQANEMENKVRNEMEREVKPIMNRNITNNQDISSVIRNQIQGDLDDMQQLEKKIKEANLPEPILVQMNKEMKRLKGLRGQNAEANVIRSYIETIIELPWNIQTDDRLDLKYAEQILNRDHSGLEIVKKRILEFLAVRFLKGNAKGTIVCLVGPPGVGKTSLGKSIADSLNRKFERIALGGVRDEAQVRGHRRTYVGALPGVFINSMKKVKSKNPVILLDEIDKITRGDMQGDPSSALLEVLDPAQNHSFTDHYIAQPFDLSQVMFIATANSLDTIQAPLLDRMEIIQIPGYTNEEKKDIATKYLIPRQIDDNGLNNNLIGFKEGAVDLVIQNYTREAGVRQLERNLGAVCRRVAVQFSKHKQEYLEQQKIKLQENKDKDDNAQNSQQDNKTQENQEGQNNLGQLKDFMSGENNQENNSNQQQNTQENNNNPKDDQLKLKDEEKKLQDETIEKSFTKINIDEDFVRDVLGVEIYDNDELQDSIKQPGIAIGMAWTQAGGKVLIIEASMSKGKGRIEVTGKLGDVMKESVKTAIGWIKSNCGRIVQLNDNQTLFEELDIHIHFPAASIPKDGPSAGITITTALISLLTGITVKQNVSMTGEISLKGRVLPVGGIKEKCLAAYAAGIRTIIIPYKNKKDTKEISNEIKRNIRFVFAKDIEEVLQEVFNKDEFQILKESITINKHSKL